MSKEELKKIVTESMPTVIRSANKNSQLVPVFMSKKAYWITIDLVTDSLLSKLNK